MPGWTEALSLDATTFAAILAMALATFACRAGGYAAFRQLHPSPFVKALLGHIPGAMFVALAAPAVVKAGPPGWVGAVVVLVVGRLGVGLLPSLVLGLGTVWGVQALLAP